MAWDLLGEVEERRRLILTSRTFAPARRTYDSLAADFGVSRERVRQLETSALAQLARAAAHDRYRPLRWRAASAARPGGARAAAIPGAPSWLGQRRGGALAAAVVVAGVGAGDGVPEVPLTHVKVGCRIQCVLMPWVAI